MIISTGYKVFSSLFFGLCLLLINSTDSSAPIYEGPDIQIIGQDFYKDLESEFQRYSYQINALEKGVPPLILKNLPSDLNKIRSSERRKSIFFKSLLPMILLANDEIRVEREKLLLIDQQYLNQKLLCESQLQILSTLSRRYKVKMDAIQPERTVHKLLTRIDIIPADLALAQAANESAWGTSRFSRVANNLFGEWTFVQGQGVVPKKRPEGEIYEIQKFATVYDSVRSYLHNLNTHPAYKQLRQLRAESRVSGQSPEGLKLAEGLLRYSTRGEDYIKELQVMIRSNKLNRFASAKLRTINI
ncbi:MAG: glucosaminidase domain-containing protein [Thermodesulfobacteriota bacterium]|nr:glucosaminidase domain-containing protein [Thermodesulfobacteriota bacterium]